MIIIAGTLTVDANEREAYLDAVHQATEAARHAPGCLDFVQAPDPLEPGRIVIYERWESEAELLSFRGSGEPVEGAPDILEADVKRYLIESVGDA